MYKKQRNKVIVIILLGVAAALMAYMAFSQNGLLHLWSLKKEKGHLDERVRQLEVQNERMKKEIERLENDTEYLQKVIRDKLGLIKPEESIVVFTPEPAYEGDKQ